MATPASIPNLQLVDDATEAPRPSTRANEAMHPKVMSEEIFTSELLRNAAYYSDETSLVLNMDVREGLNRPGIVGGPNS